MPLWGNAQQGPLRGPCCTLPPKGAPCTFLPQARGRGPGAGGQSTGKIGVEPIASGFEDHCSTIELLALAPPFWGAFLRCVPTGEAPQSGLEPKGLKLVTLRAFVPVRPLVVGIMLAHRRKALGHLRCWNNIPESPPGRPLEEWVGAGRPGSHCAGGAGPRSATRGPRGWGMNDFLGACPPRHCKHALSRSFFNTW